MATPRRKSGSGSNPGTPVKQAGTPNKTTPAKASATSTPTKASTPAKKNGGSKSGTPLKKVELVSEEAPATTPKKAITPKKAATPKTSTPAKSGTSKASTPAKSSTPKSGTPKAATPAKSVTPKKITTPKTATPKSATKRKVDDVEEEEEVVELTKTTTNDTDELSIPSLVFEEDSSEEEEEDIDDEPKEVIKTKKNGVKKASKKQELDSEDEEEEELEKLLRDEDGDVEDEDEDDDDLVFSDDENDYTPDPRRLKAMGIEVRSVNQGRYSKYEDSENVTWTTGADGKPRPLLPEIAPVYDSDDTDNEDVNTIGNIPISAYDTMPHIGYDIDGKRIMRPANKSAIDSLLETIDLPEGWTGLIDKDTGGSLNLTKEELDIIKRIQRGENPDDAINPYEDYVDWFTHEQTITPLQAIPEPKRRFVPSKHEAKRVMKIVRAIREGKLTLKKPKQFGEEDEYDFEAYDIWAENENEQVRVREDHLPAPKLLPPTHEESYNPPAEYLPDDEEREEWEKTAPENRERNFLPKKYDSLRKVAGYSESVKERYERSLDLYLAPRVRQPKLDIDPDSLVPELPSPKDLRPFPIKHSIIYAGHKGRVRTVSVDPTGQFLATGGDDGTVRVWEILTGRELWRLNVVKADTHDDSDEEEDEEEESSDEEKDRSQDDHVDIVQWNPNAENGILAAAAGDNVYLMVPPLFDTEKEIKGREAIEAGWGFATGGHLRKNKEDKFKAGEEDEEDEDEETSYIKKKEVAKWAKAGPKLADNGVGAIIRCKKPVKKLSWHRRGDYFVTVSPKAQNLAVLVHQLSKHNSQSPFKRSKGIVQDAMFHPIKPQLFVATQRFIRVYDLQAQVLAKKLQPNVTWLSSIDVHPLGDNIIAGSYDKRLTWHDLDLSTRPYKTLRYHEKAIRDVAFHKGGLPLFCSASDDGSIDIFHGTVYDDLMKNPLLVPLKILKGHEVKNSLGVLATVWHPKEAWVFSAGADGTARLWTT